MVQVDVAGYHSRHNHLQPQLLHLLGGEVCPAGEVSQAVGEAWDGGGAGPAVPDTDQPPAGERTSRKSTESHEVRVFQMLTPHYQLYFSAREQRLSVVLILIAVIFILSSLPRIIIMMYDVIIIERLRSCIAAGYLGEGFPVWNHLLGYISHVLLSFVPSANFLVYCLVGNKFRRIGKMYLRKVLKLSPDDRTAVPTGPGSLRSSSKLTPLPDISRNKSQ